MLESDPAGPADEIETTQLAAELAGLDALDEPFVPHATKGTAVWSNIWPKIAAVGLVFFLWQALVWTHWKPEYVLPSPPTALKSLKDLFGDATFWKALRITLRRAAEGYGLALVIGSLVGIAVSRVRFLRLAVGSFITGLQTMPSIAWFPIAILFFHLSEGAILFVVVLGAAPSIANGVISGIDHVPPLLVRTGRVLGAKRFALYRHFIIPAAMPTFVSGLKQGWSFAWRSLMAGELLVIIASQPSIGSRLQFARDFNDAPQLVAYMLVIFILGVVADGVFSYADASMRRRRGLVDTASR